MSNPYAPPPPSPREEHRPGADDESRPGSHDAPPPGAGGEDRGPEPAGDPGDRPPRRQRTTPEQLARTSRPVLHFGLFMLAAVLTLQSHLPWQLASLAFAGGALYVGVRALIRVVRERLGATIVALLSVGLLLTGLLVATSLANLTLWSEQMERQECLRSAVTVAAQDRCEQAYQEAVQERTGLG